MYIKSQNNRKINAFQQIWKPFSPLFPETVKAAACMQKQCYPEYTKNTILGDADCHVAEAPGNDCISLAAFLTS